MYHCSRFYFWFVFGFLSVVTTVSAQQNDPELPIGSTRQDTVLEQGILPLDTAVPMTYVLISNPNQNFTFSDTFQWEDNKHIPILGYQAHLGNLGSATRSLAPSINNAIGFHTGWTQYDPYYLHQESFSCLLYTSRCV